jgi:dTMP kinase
LGRGEERILADRPRGFIIGIEGIDAVGKHTHSLLLLSWLHREGKKTASMSFPDYDTMIGKEIRAFLSGGRNYPKELQHMLFAANRWEKSGEIESHLRSGKTILVNRYTESNLAYGVANGLDVSWLANLEKGLPKTDLVLVLDAAPHSLKARRAASSMDRYEKDHALQAGARKAYRELARKRGWTLIDAEGSVKEVQDRVVEAVGDALASTAKVRTR